MKNNIYLSSEDEAVIGRFIKPHMDTFFSPPQAPLYHYTTGENFIKIIQSGELWATQAACLNDTTELAYFVDQLLLRVKARMSAPHDPAIDPVLSRLNAALSAPGVETSPIFVTCFSERKDDLSQWRAYSGGEGGYAIEFDPMKLIIAGLLPTQDGKTGAHSLLVRVEYNSTNQASILDEIVKLTEELFRNLSGAKKAPTIDAWADEFCRSWVDTLAFYAPCIKNPAFEDEKERRLIYYLRPDDLKSMRFRQRQSMMSRHIPLRLNKPLPITKVLVGPCRHPRLSQVAAGDLLAAAGYDPDIVKVELTEVPYRTT